jgi:hypothetical protein
MGPMTAMIIRMNKSVAQLLVQITFTSVKMESVSLKHTFAMERTIVAMEVTSHMSMLAYRLLSDVQSVSGNVQESVKDVLILHLCAIIHPIVQMVPMKVKVAILLNVSTKTEDVQMDVKRLLLEPVSY